MLPSPIVCSETASVVTPATIVTTSIATVPNLRTSSANTPILTAPVAAAFTLPETHTMPGIPPHVNTSMHSLPHFPPNTFQTQMPLFGAHPFLWNRSQSHSTPIFSQPNIFPHPTTSMYPAPSLPFLTPSMAAPPTAASPITPGASIAPHRIQPPTPNAQITPDDFGALRAQVAALQQQLTESDQQLSHVSQKLFRHLKAQVVALQQQLTERDQQLSHMRQKLSRHAASVAQSQRPQNSQVTNEARVNDVSVISEGSVKLVSQVTNEARVNDLSVISEGSVKPVSQVTNEARVNDVSVISEGSVKPVTVKSSLHQASVKKTHTNKDVPSRSKRESKRRRSSPSSSSSQGLQRKVKALEKQLKDIRKARQSKTSNDRINQPLSSHIRSLTLPRKIKLFTQKFDGKGNPNIHLDMFIDYFDMQGIDDDLKCRIFPSTLVGPAREWYSQLRKGSITSFRKLRNKFQARYMLSILLHSARTQINS